VGGCGTYKNYGNEMTLSWALGTCYIDREQPPKWRIQHLQ
jgi:hypothetical protein